MERYLNIKQSIYHRFHLAILLLSLCLSLGSAQTSNVIIAVIDGARYSETFGAEDALIPHIWNEMRPAATIYTNFYNNGLTNTCSGHATIASGTWQYLPDNGTVRPTFPTIFEEYRRQTGADTAQTFVVAGVNKLNILTYSTFAGYGSSYTSAVLTNEKTGDLDTYHNLITVMREKHPILLLVNFKEVDIKGHAADWDGYLAAIKQVDSLIYQLWQNIEQDPFYQSNTTLFVTNDHGRHDDLHGGFESHGDSCEGCRHIMLLVAGPDIKKGQIITEERTLIDIAPTAADLLAIKMPYAQGLSRFNELYLPSIKLDLFTANIFQDYILLQWRAAPDTLDYDFILERSDQEAGSYSIILIYPKNNHITPTPPTSGSNNYFYSDYNIMPNTTYWYKLAVVQNSQVLQTFKPIVVTTLAAPELTGIRQDQQIPESYLLQQNFPNPFNSSTVIGFILPQDDFVQLSIYNNLGQEISSLVSKYLPAGNYNYMWNAEEQANGAYYYILKSGNYSSVKKMTLIK
jgi:hypothetical protein